MDDPEDTEGTGPAAEMDSDHEEEDWGGGGDFVFDDTGACVSFLHSEAVAPADAPAPPADAEAEDEPVPKRRRRQAKTREICFEAPGSEGGGGGDVRVETEGARTPSIFRACRYYWLYFATAPAAGMEIVPVLTLAGPQKCHAILDDTADIDGNPVPRSNSTFEFAGTSVDLSQSCS